jgi:hypothetical protein
MGILKEMMWDRLGAIYLLVRWDLGLKVGALELEIIEWCLWGLYKELGLDKIGSKGWRKRTVSWCKQHAEIFLAAADLIFLVCFECFIWWFWCGNFLGFKASKYLGKWLRI